MRHRIVALAMMATLLAGGLATAFGQSGALAQADAAKPSTLFQITLDAGVLPTHWSALRLLRINMDPGANSPLHTHPGPELWRVDTGTVTVFVQGPAKVYPGSDPTKVKDAVQATEFEVKKGDSIAFLPGAAMTFTNKSKSEVKILAVVILPTGNQAPPGIQYVGQSPSQDAFKGIKSDFLGDGKADSGIEPNANGDIMPAGQAVVTLDTLKLGTGQSIPASPNPTLISIAKGSLEFNVTAGCAEVFHTTQPSAQNCAAEGVKGATGVQDAIFFPYGTTEIVRPPTIADVTIYRLTISPADSKATPVAAASGTPATIQVTGPTAPTPTATPKVTETPKAAETPKTAKTETPKATSTTAAATTITQGATVYITQDSVRLRSGPSTSSDIVTGLTAGQKMTVTGPSQTADGFTWWPVQDASDPSISGFVAQDFLSLTPP